MVGACQTRSSPSRRASILGLPGSRSTRRRLPIQTTYSSTIRSFSRKRPGRDPSPAVPRSGRRTYTFESTASKRRVPDPHPVLIAAPPHAVAPWLELGFDIHFYLDWRNKPSTDASYPRVRGAYGYHDDHPIARQRFWSTAEYLADRCAALVGLVPGVTTFYVNHHFLCRCLDDGFNWSDQLH